MITRKMAIAALAVSVTLSGANAFAKESRHGSFVYVENKDDFDGTDRSFIYTPSESSSRDAALSWRCMSDGLNVIYILGHYFGGDEDEDIQVRYRFDDQEPSAQQYWELLQGNEAAYIRMNRVSQFTEAAKRASVARFEAIDPLDGERLTDVFSLNGMSVALEKLPCY